MKNLLNYGDWENIKKAIEAEFKDFDYSMLRPYIWKDENDDIFFLTRCMEIYFYDKTTLRCLCFSKYYAQKLCKMGQIPLISSTDDGIYIFEAKMSELGALITYPKPLKRKINKVSNKIIRLEGKLGHKIRFVSFPLQKGEKKKNTPERLKPFLFKKK